MTSAADFGYVREQVERDIRAIFDHSIRPPSSVRRSRRAVVLPSLALVLGLFAAAVVAWTENRSLRTGDRSPSATALVAPSNRVARTIDASGLATRIVMPVPPGLPAAHPAARRPADAAMPSSARRSTTRLAASSMTRHHGVSVRRHDTGRRQVASTTNIDQRMTRSPPAGAQHTVPLADQQAIKRKQESDIAAKDAIRTLRLR